MTLTSVNTGQRAWTSPMLSGELYGEPLAFAGDVFVATENDTVYALSLHGSVVWSRTPGHCGALVDLREHLAGGIVGNTRDRPGPRRDLRRSRRAWRNGHAEHFLVGLSTTTGQIEMRVRVDPRGSDPTALLQRTGLELRQWSACSWNGRQLRRLRDLLGSGRLVKESGSGPDFFTVDNRPGDSQGAVWMGEPRWPSTRRATCGSAWATVPCTARARRSTTVTRRSNSPPRGGWNSTSLPRTGRRTTRPTTTCQPCQRVVGRRPGDPGGQVAGRLPLERSPSSVASAAAGSEPDVGLFVRHGWGSWDLWSVGVLAVCQRFGRGPRIEFAPVTSSAVECERGRWTADCGGRTRVDRGQRRRLRTRRRNGKRPAAGRRRHHRQRFHYAERWRRPPVGRFGVSRRGLSRNAQGLTDLPRRLRRPRGCWYRAKSHRRKDEGFHWLHQCLEQPWRRSMTERFERGASNECLSIERRPRDDESGSIGARGLFHRTRPFFLHHHEAGQGAEPSRQISFRIRRDAARGTSVRNSRPVGRRTRGTRPMAFPSDEAAFDGMNGPSREHCKSAGAAPWSPLGW